jgi:hypothetical protein
MKRPLSIVAAVLLVAALFAVPEAFAQQDLGDIMKDNVAESSRKVGQGWITLISLIGWILAPLGIIGMVGAAKQKSDWKGPTAAFLIGSVCLAMVYVPGLVTQTVLRQDAEGLQDLGVE